MNADEFEKQMQQQQRDPEYWAHELAQVVEQANFYLGGDPVFDLLNDELGRQLTRCLDEVRTELEGDQHGLFK